MLANQRSQFGDHMSQSLVRIQMLSQQWSAIFHSYFSSYTMIHTRVLNYRVYFSQAPKKHDMESEGDSDSERDNFDSEDSSEDEVCAECNKVHKGLWIQCDICNQWFCEDCVPIIKSLQRRGEDFYCDAVFCQRGKRIRDRADQPSKVTRPRLTKLSTV